VSTLPVGVREYGSMRLVLDQENGRKLIATGSWEGIQLSAEFDQDSNKTVFLALEPVDPQSLKPKGEVQHPLAKTYQASCSSPDVLPGIDRLVIKVPDLTNRALRAAGDMEYCTPETKDYLQLCRKTFQQEYDLVDRFSDRPSVLPSLFYGKYDSEFVESTLPEIHVAFDDKQGVNYYPDTIPCVVRTKIEGIGLSRWLRTQRAGSNGVFQGLSSLEEWLTIADSLFESIQKLHTERATHGFVYPGNIIVSTDYTPGDQLYLINAAERNREVFFKGLDANSEATQYPIRRSYDPFESLYTFRETSSDGWSRFTLEDSVGYYSTTDIFSIGVTLAYLATGEEDIYKIVSPYEHLTPWEQNPGWQIVKGRKTRTPYHLMKAVVIDALMKASSNRKLPRDAQQAPSDSDYGIALRMGEIILQCVRSREDRRVQNSQHAQNVLRIFTPYNNRPYRLSELPVSYPQNFVDSILKLSQGNAFERDAYSKQIAAGLLERGAQVSGPEDLPMLRDLLGLRLQATFQRTSTLWQDTGPQPPGQDPLPPSLRVVGSRTTLNDAFLLTLAGLPPTSECIALTTATIWSEENFGPTSRISSMIQLMRLNHCVFKWIILVPTTGLFTPEVQRIMGFRGIDDQIMAKFKGPDGTPSYPDAFYYLCLPPKEYEQLLMDKRTFIGFRTQKKKEDRLENDLELHIAPDFSERDGRLVAMTYWTRPRRGKRLVRSFQEYARMMQPLSSFERLL